MSKFDTNPFPVIKKSIESLIEDEEGTIPAGRMLTIGAFMVVFGMLFATEAFAGHSSHQSHSSHSSHSSGSGDHSSHYSHTSHSSHSSGSHSSHSSGSHSSHASHASHSSGSHSSHSSGSLAAGSQASISDSIADSTTSVIPPSDVVGIQTPESTPKIVIP